MDRRKPTPMAFWLLPAEPARSKLNALIQQFSVRFAAPAFEPHLTVHGDLSLSLQMAEQHFVALAQSTPALFLPVLQPETTAEYFKTFFLALGVHPALTQLATAIRTRLAPDSQYRLQPHLSLLYASLTPEKRVALLETFRTDLTHISFDTLALATPGCAEEGWGNVSNWQTPLRQPLTGT